MKLKVYPNGKAELYMDNQENVLLCYGYLDAQKDDHRYSHKLNYALKYFGVDNNQENELN